jgi:hypothetical protein
MLTAPLSTYYCWSDLLYGPDGRPGELIWHGGDSAAAIAETIARLPEAVILQVSTRSGDRIRGHLPGGLAA